MRKFHVAVAYAILAGAISGCANFKDTNDNSGRRKLSQEDIDNIERNDTTGTVSAAREAAENLLAEAKAQAAKIVADAKKLSAPEKASIRVKFENLARKESKAKVESIIEAARKNAAAKIVEANKKAAKIIADAKKNAAKITTDAENSANKSQAIVKKAKIEAEKIIADAENASKKGNAIIAAAQTKAADIVAKAKLTAKKIESALLDQASKSAADIIKKSQADALKIKSAAEKVAKDADVYAAKKKSDADIYLKKKMAEADKAAEDFQKQISKGEAGKISKADNPAMADNILSEILKGMSSGSYELFTKHFTKDLKKKITLKAFRMMIERLKQKTGEYESRQFLGTVRKGPWVVYLWKAKYAKIKNSDLILRLVLGELDGTQQVFAFDVSNL